MSCPRVLPTPAGHPHEEVLYEEQVEVAGHGAVVREVRYRDGSGLYPEGTRLYSCFVDRDGRLLLINTVALPDLPERRYEASQDVVDRAAETLRLDG